MSTANKRATGWRKKQIMTKQREQMENKYPLEVVKIVVEALDDAYAAGVRNSSKRPEWVGLTDEEIWKDDAIMSANSGYGATFDTLRDIVRAVEAKLKEKNGYA